MKNKFLKFVCLVFSAAVVVSAAGCSVLERAAVAEKTVWLCDEIVFDTISSDGQIAVDGKTIPVRWIPDLAKDVTYVYAKDVTDGDENDPLDASKFVWCCKATVNDKTVTLKVERDYYFERGKSNENYAGKTFKLKDAFVE